MSHGVFCSCEEKSKPVAERAWQVMARGQRASRSCAIESSEYSSLTCVSCGAVWRTKAGYVSELRDAPREGG